MATFEEGGVVAIAPVFNNIRRFISFITPLAAVAIHVIVNTYFLTFYIDTGQEMFAVIGQFSGVDTVEMTVIQESGLFKVVENIDQEVYLLDKRQA